MFILDEGLIFFLITSKEAHQRAAHCMRCEDISLDVAQMQLLNSSSEESLGRYADLLQGDQSEMESYWSGPFIWTDKTGASIPVAPKGVRR